MDLPTELPIFEILRRDILAGSEPLGSKVGSNFSTSDVDGSYVPSFSSSFSSPSIQMRPLMHLEHRKPTNAALDDLLVAIVCVSSSNGDDVGGGGCHGRRSTGRF